MSVKQYFWDEEGNRVHRARGKCKSGVWYTILVAGSDYDALVAQNERLRAAVAELLAVRALSLTKHGCRNDRFEAAWKQASTALSQPEKQST